MVSGVQILSSPQLESILDYFMSIEDFYNKIYSENDNVYGNGQPEKMVESVLKFKNSGQALELGAGEGRNSLFLANHGFKVKAQDISEVGLNKLSKIATEKKLDIQTEIKNINDLKLTDNFDVLVCTFVLHNLSRENALQIIEEMKNHTNPEGLNVITAFTKNGDFYNRPSEKENFYLDGGELKNLYAGWDILEYEEAEGEARAKKQDGTAMKNVTAKLLAKKI